MPDPPGPKPQALPMPEQPQSSRTDMDAKLEAEIEAALGGMSVEDMLDYADRPREVRGERERRTGTVVNVHGGDVFVEFGPKSQGICPITQFPEAPQPGQQLEFIVERYDAKEELLILAREGSVGRAEWESLAEGQVIEARCTATNKGGLTMDVAGHEAFMPAAHVDIRHVENLEVFVGEKMPCQIIEFDRRRNRLVLSRRIPLEADRARRREKLLETLQVGATMQAVVTSIRDFGAFADLGGIDGLIHISDLSYQRVKHPSEVVKEGDGVTVKVLRIDRDTEPPRVGLGLKQTLEDPFRSSTADLQPGATVSGRVTKLTDFGAFVEIAPGVEGLIHISELSRERVRRVSDVVKADEIVTVKVLAVDPAQRRIGLSLKAVQPDEDPAGFDRPEDAEMKKMRALLNRKFGDNLSGGLDRRGD